MTKRKRLHGAPDPVSLQNALKAEVDAKIVHGTKQLNRALKTAKGFEWQKLVKRIKLVGEKGVDDGDGVEREKRRLEEELEALKGLDLRSLAEMQIHKRLGKLKVLERAGVVLEFVREEREGREEDGDEGEGKEEEKRLAVSNVTARLFNVKAVKETMTLFMEGIYGLPGLKDMKNKAPDAVSKNGKADARTTQGIGEGGAEDAHILVENGDEDELSWSGFGSESESDSETMDLSRYEGLIGRSSDEENEDGESDDGIRRPSKSKTIISRGLSVSVSGSSNSGSPPPQPKKSSNPHPPASKPGSMFLPTLMNGYWSGSEESATDDEAPAPRKNRPGQQARRAKWEKKYGGNANHVKGRAKTRESEWDPKRGATEPNDRVIRRGKGGPPFVKRREQATGENAVAVQPRRGRGLGKRDDEGAIHPSWAAAKRAKEMAKPSMAFQGKKVVFD